MLDKVVVDSSISYNFLKSNRVGSTGSILQFVLFSPVRYRPPIKTSQPLLSLYLYIALVFDLIFYLFFFFSFFSLPFFFFFFFFFHTHLSATNSCATPQPCA
eukprot:TRINITY_DN2451_c2_g2_i2.p3 TRINITY_DN2451_c2_g2~~TRINITY_DN2451_c2_g2_i2.p3  ORF type:complete len:102 (-),score=1.98 TRINITY_DN2451_c2_g2_i2:165-470(-)